MSGGSLDYFYCQLQDHVGDFKDKELDDLVADLADLFHDREWYLSSDIGEGEWNEARNKFKQKWFGEGARAERIEKYLDEVKAELLHSFGVDYKYCKDCKHWTANPDITKDGKVLHSDLGRCEFVTTCRFHRCETCDKWEKKDE